MYWFQKIVPKDVGILEFIEEENYVNQQIAFVEECTLLVHPSQEVSVVTDDPDDNKIVSCALEAKADYIVTADQHLLKLIEVEGIKIVTVREFLEILG